MRQNAFAPLFSDPYGLRYVSRFFYSHLHFLSVLIKISCCLIEKYRDTFKLFRYKKGCFCSSVLPWQNSNFRNENSKKEILFIFARRAESQVSQYNKTRTIRVVDLRCALDFLAQVDFRNTILE